MTTAQLHPLLRGDIEKLKMIDAVVLLTVATIGLAVPATVIRWFGLGDTTEVGMRGVAVAFLVLGAIAAALTRRDIPRWVAAAFAASRLALALFLVAAPLALALAVTARGWFVIGALFFFLAASAGAWFFVRDRISDAGRRSADYSDSPTLPSSDVTSSDR